MRPAAQNDIQKVKHEKYNRVDQKKNLLKHFNSGMKVCLTCSVQTDVFLLLSEEKFRSSFQSSAQSDGAASLF